MRFTFLALLLTAAACGDDDDEATPPGAVDAGIDPTVTAQAAIDLFWSAYHGNEYGRIAEVQDVLRAAIDLNPEDGALVAYLAASHWWHVSEFTRDPQADPSVLQQDMPTAVELMTRAAELAPDDDHLPGFIGVTSVHLGRMIGDADLVVAGDAALDYSVYLFPEFNNFNRWAAYNADPRDSDTYRKALDSLWQAVDACAGTTVDRNNPDLTPYIHLATSHGRKRACWENEQAPYGFQGIMLNFGNGLVKAGQIEQARVAYRNAKLFAIYESWPYRGVLEEIEASDLEERAALYADADPNKDPDVTVPDRG